MLRSSVFHVTSSLQVSDLQFKTLKTHQDQNDTHILAGGGVSGLPSATFEVLELGIFERRFGQM